MNEKSAFATRKTQEDEEPIRDYRALMSLLKFDKIDETISERSSDRTRKIIEIWIECYEEANFQKLLQHLERIQRFDVYDDVITFMGLFAILF